MLNSYAEKNMKNAIDDLTENFLVRVGGRRKQILTEAICNILTGAACCAEPEQIREFNQEFARYWNAKVLERGLNNMIRIRDAQAEGKKNEEE